MQNFIHDALPIRVIFGSGTVEQVKAEAESEGEIVKAVTLTRWLGVSAPAVTMAIKRLKRDALIRVADDGNLSLTPSGPC